MAWTAPMTAVANTVFTAAQFNTHVRDNLLETAPAKASAAGQLFVSTGLNAIVARTPTVARVAAAESTTTIGSFGDLSTVGPTVGPIATGSSAIVVLSAQQENGTGTGGAIMGYAVTGASSIAATNDKCLRHRSGTGGMQNRASTVVFETGLTPGNNTFTAKYTTPTAGTATFAGRELAVIPL
jgi:hypothetical protein